MSRIETNKWLTPRAFAHAYTGGLPCPHDALA